MQFLDPFMLQDMSYSKLKPQQGKTPGMRDSLIKEIESFLCSESQPCHFSLGTAFLASVSLRRRKKRGMLRLTLQNCGEDQERQSPTKEGTCRAQVWLTVESSGECTGHEPPSLLKSPNTNAERFITMSGEIRPL